MSAPRPGSAGATRACPHCKTVILESASVCPSCRHHLRFDDAAITVMRARPVATPLHVEGTVQHPADGGPWEYTVVVVIRDDRGNETGRQVVGVGALQPGEQRSFSLAVEVVQRDDLKGKLRRH
ncbi:MAG: FxLYD domain-containing protein [Pseudoxanthomonas sp.]